MRIVVVDPSRTVLKAVSKLLESEGHAVSVFVDAGGGPRLHQSGTRRQRLDHQRRTITDVGHRAVLENTAADRLRPDDLHHSDVLQLGRAASNQRPR
jgi:CheY-like chemotaxis protein